MPIHAICLSSVLAAAIVLGAQGGSAARRACIRSRQGDPGKAKVSLTPC